MIQTRFDRNTANELSLKANKGLTTQFWRKAGTTFRFETTDVAQTLPAASLVDANGNNALAVLVTVEAFPIRYAYGTAPSLDTGHLLNPGDSLTIEGVDDVKSLQFVNIPPDPAPTEPPLTAILQITAYF